MPRSCTRSFTLSFFRSGEALRLQALTQPGARTMHQYSIVGDTYLKNPTDLARIEILDLPQDECFALVDRQAVHAAANQLADFLRQHQTVQIGRWASPHA